MDLKKKSKDLFLDILGWAFLFGPVYLMGFGGNQRKDEPIYLLITLIGAYAWGRYIVYMLNRRCEQCKKAQEKKKSGKKKNKV